MKKMDLIEVLSQTGSLYILLVLLEKQKMKTLELLDEIPVGRTAAYTAFDKLVESGLIKDIKEGIPKTRIFYLTDKGKIVAKKIKEMLEEIEKMK